MTPYYDQDGITIYHGDCRDVLPGLPRVDAVVTDPPYGVNYQGKSTKHTQRAGGGYTQGDSDTAGPDFMNRWHGRAVVYPGARIMYDYPKPTEVGFVYCPSGAGLGRWGFTTGHPILYYGKCPYLARGMGHRPNGFESFDTQKPNGHPCPKPLSWMLFAVTKASADTSDIILDPFMGSGTTLRAAKDLGRRAIGIEIEERYCEIAANRLAQGVLFGAGYKQ